MSRKNCIKFLPAVINTDGEKKTSVEIGVEYRNLDSAKKVGRFIDFIENGGVVGGDVTLADGDTFDDAFGAEIAKLKAENFVRETVLKKMLSAMKDVDKFKEELTKEFVKLHKTYEHEKIYIAEKSGNEIIKLYNRYDNNIALVKENSHYKLIGDYYYIGITKGENNTISAIDPEGGPMLHVGGKIPTTDKIIRKINCKGNYYLIYTA